VRVSLLVLLVVLSGCATTSPPAGGHSRPIETRALFAANGPAQRSGGGRTQKVGLPLTRAQKIGLWTGVAVLLAYLMADSDDAEASSPVEGP
jgi:hypothetical protein